ncbi:hypothetical protein ACTMU2_39555 [Cupriavidus basilensis]
MAGMALAIYATDDSGQLWHFPLADAARRPAQRTPTCRHKLPVAGKPERAEPPLLVGGSPSPLIVFGQGSEVAAISTRAAGIPTRIVAEPAGAGFLLRASPGRDRSAPGAGWHLTLPNAGEQLEALVDVFPGYLYSTTRAADGLQRAYSRAGRDGRSPLVVPGRARRRRFS